VVLGALIDALEQCQEAATSEASEAEAAAASALIKQHKETLEAPFGGRITIFNG
jgi:multidrug resistance efflux pump